ncbi:MAG: sodium-translocating pyrophosphatase [Phycisphaeraceae bacterium]|nr:sodium-translocating pyrophosphatase [Phycisphaeraceae bacterium]
MNTYLAAIASSSMLGSGSVLSLPALANVRADAALTSGSRMMPFWWFLIPAGALTALIFARRFYASVLAADPGNARMREVAGFVREGAYAYLKRQYKIVAMVFIALAIVLAFLSFGLHVQHPVVPFAFLTGGFASALAGFIGMKTATMASSRTAQGAGESLNRGLQIAFRAGAVMGLTVVGLSLFDISIWFSFLYLGYDKLVGGEPLNMETITVVMLCFGMGASTQALVARVGGGIYTKAADVGADLVGKVEAGIPEDDPRNPATIADNVGDNVGDVAGMGADLYESYAGSILATAALGVAAASVMGYEGERVFSFLAAPMLLAACGIFASIIGVHVVRTGEDASMGQLLSALNRGIYLATAAVVVAALIIIWALGIPTVYFLTVLIGLVLGLLIGKSTEWSTAAEYAPTRRIAEQANTGPATLIIGGIAEGMLSTWRPILFVCLAMMLAFTIGGGFGDQSGSMLLGLYGVGLAAVGMLSTLGITLATDAYGPIADNAGGNAEMSQLPKYVRERTDALDSLGNTTAAIGKGFAIGSAALTALALLASYVEQVRVGIHREAAMEYRAPDDGSPMRFMDMGFGKFALHVVGSDGSRHANEMFTISLISGAGRNSLMITDRQQPGRRFQVVISQVGQSVADMSLTALSTDRYEVRRYDDDASDQTPARLKAGLADYMRLYEVHLINPNVLTGVFLGVLLVFVFCALTMKAVGRAAFAMVREVRRQFAEIPGIMEGTQRPDYAQCVKISTAGAQREMILPSALAIAAPVVVGLVLNVAGLLGLLVGGLCTGFAMAVFMANAGGAWDNAKKYIEAGHHGGKGGDPHKASVVGDTVGDPFKDTSGPSLNILIKLMTMVSIVFAGLIVKFGPVIGGWLGISP